MALIDGLSWSHPLALGVGLLFLPALVRELRRAGPRRSVWLTGLQDLPDQATWRKRSRALVIGILAV